MRNPALLLALLFAVGCVYYDVRTYGAVAAGEQRALAGDTTQPVGSDRCAAHERGATALRDETGDGWALRIPLGSAAAVGEFAEIHERQGLICRELLAQQAAAIMIPVSTFSEIRDGWAQIWREGETVLVTGESRPDTVPTP